MIDWLTTHAPHGLTLKAKSQDEAVDGGTRYCFTVGVPNCKGNHVGTCGELILAVAADGNSVEIEYVEIKPAHGRHRYGMDLVNLVTSYCQYRRIARAWLIVNAHNMPGPEKDWDRLAAGYEQDCNFKKLNKFDGDWEMEWRLADHPASATKP